MGLIDDERLAAIVAERKARRAAFLSAEAGGSGQRSIQKKNRSTDLKRRKPSLMMLVVAGLAIAVHGLAGLTVISPSEATLMETVEPPAFLRGLEMSTELAPLGRSAERLYLQISHVAPPALRLTLSALDTTRRPAIALIIDDVGLSARATRGAIDLPLPVTLSFLPYGEDVQALADEARAAGHEIFLHLPMEPVGEQDPGPEALISDLDPAALAQRIESALASFEGYTGINNHMGSRLTQDAGLMAEVMTHVASRNVDFVDSLTSQQSVAFAVAEAHGIPSARRDVFIDHDINGEEINERLYEAEIIARFYGTAIAIAHPHETSLEALEAWLAGLDAAGFDVVPVSEVIRRRNDDGKLVALQ